MSQQERKLSEKEIEELKDLLTADFQARMDLALNAVVTTEREKTKKEIRRELEIFCPYGPEHRAQVKHGIGIILDLGDGRFDQGLREFRKNQVWVKSLRENSDRYSKGFWLAIISIAVLGFGNAIYHGARFLMTGSSE